MSLRQYLPTRDSWIWNVLLLLGSIAAAINILGLKLCDPHMEWMVCAADATRFAYYGIPDRAVPYIRLASLLTPIVAAWMKSSPASHSEYGSSKLTSEDTRKDVEQRVRTQVKAQVTEQRRADAVEDAKDAQDAKEDR